MAKQKTLPLGVFILWPHFENRRLLEWPQIDPLGSPLLLTYIDCSIVHIGTFWLELFCFWIVLHVFRFWQSRKLYPNKWCIQFYRNIPPYSICTCVIQYTNATLSRLRSRFGLLKPDFICLANYSKFIPEVRVVMHFDTLNKVWVCQNEVSIGKKFIKIIKNRYKILLTKNWSLLLKHH